MTKVYNVEGQEVDCLEVGEMVGVDEQAYYPGQDMKWTEIMKPGTVEKGTMLYHYSDSLIEEFAAKETCFFNGEYCPRGFCYRLIVPFDMECETDGREVRVVLEQGMLLEYIGCQDVVTA